MADCEFLARCPFFNDRLPNMPATADYLKSYYCQREYEACARYKVAKVLSSAQVPIDLFPSDTDRVERLIGKKK